MVMTEARHDASADRPRLFPRGEYCRPGTTRFGRTRPFVTTLRHLQLGSSSRTQTGQGDSTQSPMFPRAATTIFVPRVADQFDVLTALGQEQRNQRGRIRPE